MCNLRFRPEDSRSLTQPGLASVALVAQRLQITQCQAQLGMRMARLDMVYLAGWYRDWHLVTLTLFAPGRHRQLDSPQIQPG